MAYLIGVDCGTSGTKTVLFDEKGSVIASKTIEYPMYQPKNGYAEQEPADWANAWYKGAQLEPGPGEGHPPSRTGAPISRPPEQTYPHAFAAVSSWGTRQAQGALGEEREKSG